MTQMRSHWFNWLAAAGLLLFWTASCSTDTEPPRFDNPLDPSTGDGLPTPESIVVEVGDGWVNLSWSLPQEETADEFAVFRKRTDTDPEESERLLGRVDKMAYRDASVRNGRAYAYRLAAVVGGQFGPRTETVEAHPGLYAILIQNDQEVTSTRQVSVTLNAEGATSVRLSEDADLTSGQWRPATGTASWTLTPGDGPKTLYARFRLSDGSETAIVSDSIELDTRAVIRSVEFTGNALRAPGETVHFRIDAGEADGRATLTVDGGVFSSVPLLDDGTNGDGTADDGIYERDLVIPASVTATESEVRGDFTDAAGNTAAQVTAPRALSVHHRPDPVDLVNATVSVPPDAPSVSVRWTQSIDSRFAQYRLLRSETASVDSLSQVVFTSQTASTVDYSDTDVYEGQALFYRVYVRNDTGLEAPSNVISVTIPNVRPPGVVDIQTPLDAGTHQIAVRWSRTNDKDFAFYRLYRNDDGAVSDQDTMVAEIDDPDLTFWDDLGLRENTTYYYRLYTVDLGGLTAQSSEASAKTKNEAPRPVTLQAATEVDTTSLTLSWTESTDHDFAFYRLYRDKIATVTTGSSLVVELDDSTFTSFHDTDLEIRTKYYYRVFVVDDADAHAGSNTISVTTADTTGRGAP
jgi:hypothetical protein